MTPSLPLAKVLLPWAWARASQYASSRDTEEAGRWLRMMRRLEGVIALASLVTTIRFFINGKAPTLPMWLLGMELAYTERGKPRRAVFDFMEQQAC